MHLPLVIVLDGASAPTVRLGPALPVAISLPDNDVSGGMFVPVDTLPAL